MRGSLIFCAIFLVSVSLHGQVIARLYYDSQWRLTKKDSAVYFRVSVFDTSNYVFAGEVQDFTMNSKLVMTGKYVGRNKDGHFTFYHVNGRVESSGLFVKNNRFGNWKYFYADGKPKQEIEFGPGSYKILFYNDSLGNSLMRDGTGFWREEYEEATVKQKIVNEGNFKDHEKDGDWICKLDNGVIITTEKFKKGRFIKGTLFDTSGNKVRDYNLPLGNT